MMLPRAVVIIGLFLLTMISQSAQKESYSVDVDPQAAEFVLQTPQHHVACEQLRLGQYLCNDTHIDPLTQQLRDCSKDTWTTKIPCIAVEGIICTETGTRDFEREVPCKWTNGYKLDTALLLSFFMGCLGADRFYLGHLGMGALKLFTFGFLLIAWLLDIILLATQQIGPKDNSSFVVGYYGSGLSSFRANNLTYSVRRADWF